MRPVLVVIANVLGHESFDVAFVEHDYMIEQIAPAGADESSGGTRRARYDANRRAIPARNKLLTNRNSFCKI